MTVAATDVIGSGLDIYLLRQTVPLYVLQGVRLTTVLIEANVVTGDYLVIDNAGQMVANDDSAIYAYDTDFTTYLRLHNHSTGFVGGYSGISVNGGGFDIVNDGVLSGSTSALSAFTGGVSSTLINTGTITSESPYYKGISVVSGAAGPVFTFANYGLVAASVKSRMSTDLTNSGHMVGPVTLSDFADYVDSRLGDIVGRVDLGAGFDRYIGGAARDRVDGGSGDDSLSGGGGDDLLVGGAGADMLDGGDGFDLVSYAGETQAVVASLTSSAQNDGGAFGDDISTVEALIGSAFADRLTGSSGANRLDGGAGADTLAGGNGADLYVSDGLDLILEKAGGGDDVVLLSPGAHPFTLAAGQEVETVRAQTGSIITGNAFAQTLVGSDQVDQLYGGGGNDRILGGDGVVDTLAGQAGRDKLTGGGGADRFYFDTAPAPGNADDILDFVIGTDVIWLNRDVFSAIPVPDAGIAELPFGAFALITDPREADDRIIYDPSRGYIFYDPDGSGGAARVLMATVSAGMALGSTSFYVVDPAIL